METEVEAKFLNIDPSVLRKRLENSGATLVHKERLMRRKNFDYSDWRLEKKGGWIRVRDEGEKVTLAYKQLNDRTLHGTQEISIDVSDFEKTGSFLSAIGLESKSYQETKRELWRLRGADVTIDTWPWISPFIEIEGVDESVVRKVTQILQLDWSQAMHGSVEIAYQAEYDVTEQEIDRWKEITFIPVPDLLRAKRKL
jgi:adenylate cyclase class 2